MAFCLYLMNNMGINLTTGFAIALNLAYFTPKFLRWLWLHWGYGWSHFDSRNVWLRHFRIFVICLWIFFFLILLSYRKIDSELQEAKEEFLRRKEEITKRENERLEREKKREDE